MGVVFRKVSSLITACVQQPLTFFDYIVFTILQDFFGVFKSVLYGRKEIMSLLIDATVWNNILKCFHSSENTHKKEL